VRAVAAYIRDLDPQLPRPVVRLIAADLANSLGNGIVMPFTIIYLHNVRGFALGTAGLVFATLGAVGLVSGLLAGRAVDLLGARTTLIASLALSAIGYGAFPLIREPWQAFGLAAIAGAGNGAFAPSHSSLLAALTSREQRSTAYALQRVTDNLGFGLGGLIGGLIATTAVPASFTLLFLLDAGTFVAFIGMLAFVPAPALARQSDQSLRGGYAAVVRDRAYMSLIALTALIVAAAYAQLSALLPPFAKDDAAVSEAGIGVIFLVNTLFIVIAQLPIAKLLEGRRRMQGMALAAAAFAAAWLIVLAGGVWFDHSAAVIVFATAVVVFGLGECLHGAIQNPLIVDLAPPALLGRYMAVRSISWQLGFMLGPAAGGFVLAHSPRGLWVAAASACLAAGAASLLLERHLPGEALVTPVRPRPSRLATRLSG
jgi:MFS family permease